MGTILSYCFLLISLQICTSKQLSYFPFNFSLLKQILLKREIYQISHNTLGNYKTNHTSFFISKLVKQQTFRPQYPCQSHQLTKTCNSPTLLTKWKHQQRAKSETIIDDNLTGIPFNSNQYLQDQQLKFKNPRLAISNTCFILFLYCVVVVCCCDGGWWWWQWCIVELCWWQYVAMGTKKFVKIQNFCATGARPTKYCLTAYLSHKKSYYTKFRLFSEGHNLV